MLPLNRFLWNLVHGNHEWEHSRLSRLATACGFMSTSVLYCSIVLSCKCTMRWCQDVGFLFLKLI